MAPQPKARNRWAVFGIAAAAVVAGVLYLAVPPRQVEVAPAAPLTAQVDTVAKVASAPIDTIAAQPAETVVPQQPVKVKAKKRGLRKSKPTIHDIDKAYALMAQVELFNAQMAAYGYVPVMQEDGTIIYINEQENLIAYEE